MKELTGKHLMELCQEDIKEMVYIDFWHLTTKLKKYPVRRFYHPSYSKVLGTSISQEEVKELVKMLDRRIQQSKEMEEAGYTQLDEPKIRLGFIALIGILEAGYTP